MEELSQAFERYKASPNGLSSGREFQKSARPIPPPIVYSRTKIVECREEVLRRHRVLSAFESGPFVDGYLLLRTQVLHRLRENHWNVLGVTSPNANEGKTLTALNLAIALARDAAQTVMLIDADLKRARVQALLGLEACSGLADYLLEDVPLENVLVHPGLGRLVVLAGGRIIQCSSEALTSPRMSALLAEVKHRYPARTIVIDLPPLLSGADALAIAPSMDALLLVVGEGTTTRSDVEAALALVRGVVPVLGTVLNRSGRSQATLKTLRKSAIAQPHTM